MVISTRIIELMYDKYPVAPDERSVIDIHLQLDTWFNSLPRELLVWTRSTSPLPHIITLHIYYWFLIICLHQPFYGRTGAIESNSGRGSNATSEASNQGGGGSAIHEQSIKMVDRATHKIVQLLQMFGKLHMMMFFPRNMIHVIYECGIALLKESATAPVAATKKRAIALEAARTCLCVLRETSRTWPWAEQLADHLEGKLNETGANNTTQLFTSDWTAPGGETGQIGPNIYPLTQEWGPAGRLASPSEGNFVNQLSGMQIDPSGSGFAANQLGLDLSPHQHGILGNHVTFDNLGGTGESAHIVGTQVDTVTHGAMPFPGAPSTSTTPYSLP
ncbi:unnamed protein product [Rhizoctonia solani]|uniref:Transcription factor domain-containing protein n=1 Tax=Rhizoctonia solani TaxID=456999 RepID=A0A8H3E9W7_9AGAM|nr:unnamed protein product [Rhizoctonia solani]